MCTSRPYRSDVVLVPASLADQPGKIDREIDRLNGVLDEAGLGRPLLGVESSTSELVALLVSADPAVVSDALLRARRERGARVPDVGPDFQLRAGTVDHNPETVEFFAAGKKTGHGICWEPSWEVLFPPPTHRESEIPGGRPVVAVLDTGVEDHPWLQPFEDGPLVVHAETHGWSPRVHIPEPGPDEAGSHRCHGTFVAGLIHMAAPDAQLLSVRVMSDEGAVSEENVVKALEWLAGKANAGANSDHLRVDVVCMAFGGRQSDAGKTHAQKLRDAMSKFRDSKVKFVASAGNGHCDCPNLPASLAADPSSPVVSVGADSPRQLTCYSNYGSWVTAWEVGTMVLSAMPLTFQLKPHATGFARWTGTSFSAATHAGRLAQQIIDQAPHPAVATPPGA